MTMLGCDHNLIDADSTLELVSRPSWDEDPAPRQLAKVQQTTRRAADANEQTHAENRVQTCKWAKAGSVDLMTYLKVSGKQGTMGVGESNLLGGPPTTAVGLVLAVEGPHGTQVGAYLTSPCELVGGAGAQTAGPHAIALIKPQKSWLQDVSSISDGVCEENSTRWALTTEY
ncbi:hypothetical protein J6590_097660 [Homalodisca vitripennis]|nr:hypothetical protein J6590_097660 [Homalodisca vitripennis]